MSYLQHQAFFELLRNNPALKKNVRQAVASITEATLQILFRIHANKFWFVSRQNEVHSNIIKLVKTNDWTFKSISEPFN